MKKAVLVLLMGINSTLGAGGEPNRIWRTVEDFNNGWTYHADNPTDWQPVELPHTWNAQDTLNSSHYRRGVSWYRRELKLTDEDLKQRLFLRFGAAGLAANVSINGEPAGRHLGGFSAFTIELTGHVHAGENRIDVQVSNLPDKTIAPVGDGLFNLYGGLYRGVQLIRAPQVCLSRDYRGGPGVRIWSENVNEETADVHVRAQIDGSATGLTVAADLATSAGEVVASGTGTASGFELTPVKHPALWSPEHPSLYTLTVRLLKEGREIDQAVVKHGFRWFKFTANNGFFLNGKPYRLRGVNRHQDFRGEGNALRPERQLQDIRLIKELGANWLRLAHYQQDDYVLQLCDELGILVWEEVPWVRDSPRTPEFEQNVENMLTEMIEQHFNHPSIVVWGMGNEIWFKKAEDGRAAEFDFVARLNAAVHREDPVRKSAIVSGDANTYSDLKIMTIPDVIGYNIYRGWYGGDVTSLTPRLLDLHQRDPDKPMVVSEFGAGCDSNVHTDKPRAFDMSQEYQVFFLESDLDQLDALPWLCGYNWWNYADFGWAKSTNPPLYNNKGMVTFDRQKKDSYHVLQALWSKIPVLYLLSPTWTTRTGAATVQYRVVTNQPVVELFHQGKSLGVQTHGFVWTVTLQPGANDLLARSGQMQSGFTVQYHPGPATAEQTPGLPTGNAANPFQPNPSK